MGDGGFSYPTGDVEYCDYFGTHDCNNDFILELYNLMKSLCDFDNKKTTSFLGKFDF